MTNKGRRSENEFVNAFTRQTPNGVYAWTGGYSGSNAIEMPDAIIVGDDGVLGIELKTISSDYCTVPEHQLDDLVTLAQHVHLDTALVVDFSHREPLIVEPVFPKHPSLSPVEQFIEATPDVFDPRKGTVDGGQALRLTKPDTDVWPSQQRGTDTVSVVAEAFGTTVTDTEPNDVTTPASSE